MDKSKEIRKETRRLLEVFTSLDENKKKTALSLIDRAAYLTVSLRELEVQIADEGWTEPYQNGREQKGMKKSAAADCYISLTKNLTAIIKTLLELVPPAERSDSRLKALMRE